MVSGSVLPPVNEALSLLDVSFVNNEWHGTPATIRRSIQILVDHISVQNVQLSRVEDILNSFGSPSQQGGTVWSKLAAKADLNRLERVEAQVDGLLNDCAQLRTQQSAAVHAHDDVVSRMELLKDQVTSMEARLGLPYVPDTASGLDQYGGTRRLNTGLGSSSPSKGGLTTSVPTGSVLDRILRLERRTDALAEMNAKSEDDAALLLAKLREMEPRLEVQINHLRGDIKQALALAAASTRLEADAESTSRIKEAEKRMLARIQSVESSLEGKVSALSAQTGITLSSELDKRVNSVYDHIDAQVQRLCGDLERLSRDKVDLTSLEHYSQRISSLFEGVAQGLADEVATLVTQLRAEVAGVTRSAEEARVKDKMLQDNLKAEMEGIRQTSGQVKEAVSAMQEALAAVQNPRPLEETRAVVRQVMLDTEQLQKAVTGLNTAMSSTSNALELQSHKLSQLSHKISGVQHDVSAVKDTLYGGVASPGGNAVEQPAPAGASLLSKLTSLERTIADMTASLHSKTDDTVTREMERRVAALVRQQDITAEGLKNLSATAFKRADDHASAIQRLTLAVSGNLEDRPTTTVVKHLLETSLLEVRERCDQALAPLWDAVRILQSGLRDAAGEVKALSANVSHVQQAQSDLRSKASTDRASLLTALRKAIDDELGSLRTQLDSRLDSMASGVRQVVEQLEVHEKLQDRLTQLTTAIEEQLATQVAAWRTGNQQLRTELCSRADAAAVGLGARLDALEVVSCKHADELKVLSETSVSKPNEVIVREIASSIASTVSSSLVKQELFDFREKELAMLQEWLEEQKRNRDNIATQNNVAAALDSASRHIRQEMESITTARIEELRRAFASLRGEIDGRVRATTSRMEVAELRIQDLEAATAGTLNRKDVEEILTSSLSQGVGHMGLETKVRQMMDEIADHASTLKHFRSEAVLRSEFTAELARKVDLATYLAQGSARAAAANAGALVGANLSPQRRRSVDAGERFAHGVAAVARSMDRLNLGTAI
ncbi:hypothetical protein VaNZ11_012907 [Volvox africanus]|uniref:Uncharacterized protein n=1 Tax=Volvox africanus TaxID=51714 RepID=A0ABQ5SH15_9CHLO|nr:hypothetical protein VaNZ11_012907 [Volvox africanus]